MNTPLQSERDPVALLDDARARVVPALRDALGSLPSAMRGIAEYHFNWRESDGRPANSRGPGGKTLRPALVLLAASAVGDPRAEADAAVVRAAVAVELVHNFSLVHDDVMDRDAMRRHRETVWKVFGVPSAILAGDALLALATQVLTETVTPTTSVAVTMLNEAVQQLIEGQSSDLAFETRTEVGLAECVAMAGRKTGALTACACALGALAAGASAGHVQALHAFGMHLGVAFQLADDLLGIWGDPAVTGKPAHNDLWTRKKSLPVVAALNSGTAAGDEFAALYRTTAAWERTDLLRCAELVELTGARAWATQEAARRVDLALACLDDPAFDPDAVAGLTSLVRMAAARDH